MPGWDLLDDEQDDGPSATPTSVPPLRSAPSSGWESLDDDEPTLAPRPGRGVRPSGSERPGVLLPSAELTASRLSDGEVVWAEVIGDEVVLGSGRRLHVPGGVPDGVSGWRRVRILDSAALRAEVIAVPIAPLLAGVEEDLDRLFVAPESQSPPPRPSGFPVGQGGDLAAAFEMRIGEARAAYEQRAVAAERRASEAEERAAAAERTVNARAEAAEQVADQRARRAEETVEARSAAAEAAAEQRAVQAENISQHRIMEAERRAEASIAVRAEAAESAARTRMQAAIQRAEEQMRTSAQQAQQHVEHARHYAEQQIAQAQRHADQQSREFQAAAEAVQKQHAEAMGRATLVRTVLIVLAAVGWLGLLAFALGG